MAPAAGARVPARTCVACRTRRDKADLVRFVRQPDGSIVIDRAGGLDGRGAYLCADPGCWRSAHKRRALERALHAALPLELRRRLEHGDVVAFHDATAFGAPGMIGGTDGT